MRIYPEGKQSKSICIISPNVYKGYDQIEMDITNIIRLCENRSTYLSEALADLVTAFKIIAQCES